MWLWLGRSASSYGRASGLTRSKKKLTKKVSKGCVNDMIPSQELNGCCENGPAVRRMLAALCAYDHQLLSKVLSKVALNYEIGWRSPKDEWAPGLLLVLDVLLRAHEFRKIKLITTSHSDASDKLMSLGPIMTKTTSFGGAPSLGFKNSGSFYWSKRCTLCAGGGLGDTQIASTQAM